MKQTHGYKQCAWCGGHNLRTTVIWGDDVCYQCEKAMVDYLGGDRPSDPPSCVKEVKPDPGEAYYYVRCDGCGNPGASSPTVQRAIELFCFEGGTVTKGVSRCGLCHQNDEHRLLYDE